VEGLYSTQSIPCYELLRAYGSTGYAMVRGLELAITRTVSDYLIGSGIKISKILPGILPPGDDENRSCGVREAIFIPDHDSMSDKT
jgi:hypothetical protein